MSTENEEVKDKHRYSSNWLSAGFEYIHDVIDSADRPISKLVMVLLPFVAPLLPALITARSLRDYMDVPNEWSWIAVVAFEGIGYLGMITLVGAIMRHIDDDKNERSWTAIYTSGTAYFIYLLSLIVTNLVLEAKNNVPVENIVVVACLTVGLSISASLLNAQRIYVRSQEDKLKETEDKQGNKSVCVEAPQVQLKIVTRI